MQAQSAERKDPAIATAISYLIPGGGQVYAGETAKGFALFGTAVAGPLVGMMTSKMESCSTNGSIYGGFDCRNANLTPFYTGLGISVATWAYSLWDARGAAERYNKAQATLARVAPVIAPGKEQTTNLGLSLAF